MRRLCAVVGFAAITAFSIRARAESAEDLFVTGQELMASGRAVEACRKFEESNRLEPAIGVRFHLAQCHERIGRTASAWRGYLDVAGEAHGRGQTARAKLARERAAALEPRLLRLTLDVQKDQTKGLTVVRNGVAVPRAEWGVASPTDPGTFVIEVSAPGRKPWRMSIELTDRKRDWVALVPQLEEGDSEPKSERHASVAASPTAAVDGDSTRKIVALALGGAGVVSIGAGILFGVMALSRNTSSAQHCTGNVCDAEGVELRDSAVTSGHLSTIGFVSGVGLLGAGVGYWFLAPRGEGRATPTARLDVLPGLGRVDVRATW